MNTDLHRNGRITFLLTVLILLICVKANAAGTVNIATDAEYHVQRNGVEQFCASHVSVSGGTLNFTGECGAPPPPPPGLYASGRLSYANKGGFITNANLLDWAVLWGRQGVEVDPTPFPGASGATPVWTPGFNQYTCSKFHTPPTIPQPPPQPPRMPTVHGQIKNSRYYSWANVDIAISVSCGDFVPAQVKCHVENVPTNDNPVLSWDIGGAGTFKCHLPPDTDMFWNIKRTDVRSAGKISVIGQQGG